jgi:ankyrin repeat protein
VVLLLKQKNCNHLQKRKDGRIALHCASANGHLECVKKLSEHDNNLDYQTDNGNTALHLACANKHINVIDYLVEKGAHTLIKNKDDSIPFLLVYLKNLQDKIKKTTLDRMLHAKDCKDNTLFHISATIYAPRDSRSYDNYLEFLIQKGLNIHARNKDHLTALDMINDTYQNFPISQIALSFWRVTSDYMQYALFKKILQILPKDLRIFILYFYYRLNINTILAKIIKRDPVLLGEYRGLEINNWLIRLPNELHHFPLLYRPAGFSYE